MARTTRGVRISFVEQDDDDDEYQPRYRSRSRPRRKSTRAPKTLNKTEKELALILVGMSQGKIYSFATDRKRRGETTTKPRPKKKPKPEPPLEPPQSYPPVSHVEHLTPPTLAQNPLINVNPFSPQCAFPRAARHICLAFYVYRKLRNEPVSSYQPQPSQMLQTALPQNYSSAAYPYSMQPTYRIPFPTQNYVLPVHGAGAFPHHPLQFPK
ncbi:hypothetical protein GEMRC1_012544 [Eukaryota sp. GEM-RC1]